MSEKLCDHHGSSRRRLLRRSCATASLLIFLLLLSILLVWVILQPKKPQFTLQDTTLFVLAIPAANVISVTVQITVIARNPNSRIGIYYDKLDAYAVYREQQITYPTALPRVYQGQKDFTVWSPFIYGNKVPVAPYTGACLSRDRSDGVVPLVIKINGQVKWRVGTFVSGHYHLRATCPAHIPVGNAAGIAPGGVKYQLSLTCRVNIIRIFIL